MRAGYSRARSSSLRARRRPTASRWRERCFYRIPPNSIPSPSLRFLPTTWSAAMVRLRARLTMSFCSISKPEVSRKRRPAPFWFRPSSARRSSASTTRPCARRSAPLPPTGSVLRPRVTERKITVLTPTKKGHKGAKSPFDVAAIRADFPILSREVNGKKLVYLDNGASAQKPRAVLDTIKRAYSGEYANVHRGLHYLSNLATTHFEQARETVRRFVNARFEAEIVFTRNATEAINLVASSYGAPNIGEGDEVLLTIMEHHSNIVPWYFLRERQGAVLKWVPIADDGAFLLDEFERRITPRTKMIAITHMSNVLGTIVPLKDVVRIAHERGIPVLADGAQGAVHLPVDVQDLDIDFYACTGHKLYGPTGIGVLYGKKEHLEHMRPDQR